MAESKKPKPDDPEQSKRFEETAKELGVDESGKAFEKAMKKVAKKPKLPAK
ncbi:hypothetical protein [Arenimonas sp.]|uniref:hypothetical protein n=1 Tax=Arenimonas sp. TaxID=1872635 RepID=UPI0039E3B6EE